jgi:hypothetical protein
VNVRGIGRHSPEALVVVVAVVVVLSGSPLGVVVVSSRSDVVMAATVDRWPFGTVTVEDSLSLFSLLSSLPDSSPSELPLTGI